MVLYLYVNDVGTLRYSTKSVTNMFLIPHEIAKKKYKFWYIEIFKVFKLEVQNL